MEYLENRSNRGLLELRQGDKDTIYLAVMKTKEETLLISDPESSKAEECLIHDASDQAYVGMASGGVADRWGEKGNHHIKCANNLVTTKEVEQVKEGVVTRSRGNKNTMLVDATMRHHCAQGGIVWIFHIGCFHEG